MLYFVERYGFMAKKLKPDVESRKPKWRLFSGVPELSGPIIQICGNREVSVDGCKGVIDYYDDRIKLRIDGGSVTFSGEGLTITSFNESAAVITGRLQNVELLVN